MTKLANGVIAAHDNRVPVDMGYGRGTVEGCAFNRMIIMNNGQSLDGECISDASIELLKQLD